jgi:hypothetical protein
VPEKRGYRKVAQVVPAENSTFPEPPTVASSTSKSILFKGSSDKKPPVGAGNPTAHNIGPLHCLSNTVTDGSPLAFGARLTEVIVDTLPSAEIAIVFL